MKREKEWFNITSVHRDDLIQAGYDGDAVDDATMECLANKMSNDYVEQLFWVHLDILAECLGIPKLPEQEDNN